MENNHIEVPANIKRKELIKTWVIVVSCSPALFRFIQCLAL